MDRAPEFQVRKIAWYNRREYPPVDIATDGAASFVAEEGWASPQIRRAEGNLGSLQGRVTILTNEGMIKH